MSTLAIVTALPAVAMQPQAGLAQPQYVDVWASNLLEQIEMVKGVPEVGFAQQAPVPAALAVAPELPEPAATATGPAQLALAQPPVAAAPQPMALARPLPVAAPLQAAPSPAPQAIWVQPEATLVQPLGDEALPQGASTPSVVVTYNLAPGESSVQGPPAPDPLANDIAWANGQTAMRRRQVEREAWRKIVPYEIAWQLLNALDAAQTIDCSNKPTCSEANPLFGKRPSTGTVLGIKGAMAIGHFFLMRHIAHRNWKAARTAEIGTILVQGLIDGLNFRYAFK